MMKKILLWAAVILMSLQIFGFSSRTAPESSNTSEKIANTIVKVVENVVEIDKAKRDDVFRIIHLTVRKGAHFAEFALLSLLTFFLARAYGLKVKICVIISLGYCLIFAATDELHQLFVPGRSGQISDVLIDFCGGIFANLCAVLGLGIKNVFFRQEIK